MHDLFAKAYSGTLYLHLLNTKHAYGAMAHALLQTAAHALLFACQLPLMHARVCTSTFVFCVSHEPTVWTLEGN